MGYRKGDRRVVRSDRGESRRRAHRRRVPRSPRSPGLESANSLRGLTRAQVRSRLGGKPDRVVRIGHARGRCVEQWIYKNGKGSQVVNFVFEPGTPDPRAASNYADQK